MATHEDAETVLQLMRWGTEMGFEGAAKAIFSPDFDPEAAAAVDVEADDNVAKVLYFGETAATLVKHGLLDRDLLLDLLWLEGMWAKVAPHARAARERDNEPRLYENFEALVTPVSV
jgi:hypothetical protein